MSENRSFLKLENLSKDYGQGMVLKGLNLEVEAGEFLTLLGPSGCGKTTTLRIIAGLETATEGKVYLDGNDVTALPPEKRNLNTVFQSYALFPHMNVYQNIAYGLKIKKLPKAEIRQRVTDVLKLVQLSGYEKRMPGQLSGGQRQRVAIARAVVLRPRVLLLDEPLGALDLKLRQQMQQELKKLQRQLGITFIYITHDQEEALNMSTRIVIMRDGKVEQIGTPEEVYEHPETLFAAGFIGQSNLLECTVEEAGEDGRMALSVDNVRLPAYSEKPYKTGDKVVLCLRPQRVRYGNEPQHGLDLKGIILEKEYSGGMQHTHICLGEKLVIRVISQSSELDSYQIGDSVHVGWSVRHAPVVPAGDAGEAQ